jgi:hypothetical protein
MNNNNPNQRQQGDVLFLRVGPLPEGVQLVCTNKITVAHGESGNSHVIESDDAELYQDGERLLLKLDAPVEVRHVGTHPEHASVTLDAGVWEVGQVVEKDWLSGMVNPIKD